MCGIILWAVFLSFLFGGFKVLWFWGALFCVSFAYGIYKAIKERKEINDLLSED